MTRSVKPLPRLFYFTDDTRPATDLGALATLRPGDGVIFRHYSAPDRSELALKTAKLCARLDLVLLVAEDYRLAIEINADGVHLPEHLLSDAPNLKKRFPKFLLTGAAHTQRSLSPQFTAHLDGVFLSPVFPTKSHPEAKPIGVVRFTRLAQYSACPVLALGGINKKTAQRLRGLKFYGFGAIGAIAELSAARPKT